MSGLSDFSTNFLIRDVLFVLYIIYDLISISKLISTFNYEIIIA